MNADKAITTLVLCLVLLTGTSFAAPVLQLGNAYLVPDGSVTLPLLITGADASYAGINARIVLPSKVHCTNVTHGSSLDTGITIAYAATTDDPEAVTVVAYSRDITFGNGEVLLFTIAADSDITPGEYSVTFDASKADVIVNSKWALATGTESVTGVTVQNSIITVADILEGEPEGEGEPVEGEPVEGEGDPCDPDITPPEVVLSGDAEILLEDCLPYEESGVASVVDVCDGDLGTENVLVNIWVVADSLYANSTLATIESDFNTSYGSASGEYTLVYSAMDSAENIGLAEREVTVVCVPLEGEGETVEGEGEQATTEEIAQNLLDTFEAADTNRDGSLSFEEAQLVMTNLTQEQFDAMDINGDNYLSREELLDVLGMDEGCGCCKKNFDTRKSIQRYIGDFLLLGLSLLILASFARKQ